MSAQDNDKETGSGTPPKDDRHVYGAVCSWNGPIAKVGSYNGLPACPHCSRMLFETSEKEWLAGLIRYAKDANDPNYPKFMDWLSTRGKCSPLRNQTDLLYLRNEFNSLNLT